jgi:hypothetical protein
VLQRTDELLNGPADGRERLRELVAEFTAITHNRDFPCTFARLPFRTGEISFALLTGHNEIGSATVPLLRQLCATIGDSPDAVGVIFVEQPPAPTLADDFGLALSIVQAVMRATAKDCPGVDLPQPDEPEWMLWLDGTGLFVNFSSPRHLVRRSRNVGSTFTVIAQARESFDRAGRLSPMVRSEIRRRLARYDGIVAHPSLGRYGDPNSREALQFFLGDGTDSYNLAGACPHVP